MRREDANAVALSRQRQIGDELPRAGGEALIFDAANRLSDAKPAHGCIPRIRRKNGLSIGRPNEGASRYNFALLVPLSSLGDIPYIVTRASGGSLLKISASRPAQAAGRSSP
jgi:hypothetical protein